MPLQCTYRRDEFRLLREDRAPLELHPGPDVHTLRRTQYELREADPGRMQVLALHRSCQSCGPCASRVLRPRVCSRTFAVQFSPRQLRYRVRRQQSQATVLPRFRLFPLEESRAKVEAFHLRRSAPPAPAPRSRDRAHPEERFHLPGYSAPCFASLAVLRAQSEEPASDEQSAGRSTLRFSMILPLQPDSSRVATAKRTWKLQCEQRAALSQECGWSPFRLR